MKITTNGLLFVITVCLALITLRLYDVSFVTTAQAQSPYSVVGGNYSLGSGDPIEVRIIGQYKAGPVAPTEWKPVRVNAQGELLVAK